MFLTVKAPVQFQMFFCGIWESQWEQGRGTVHDSALCRSVCSLLFHSPSKILFLKLLELFLGEDALRYFGPVHTRGRGVPRLSAHVLPHDLSTLFTGGAAVTVQEVLEVDCGLVRVPPGGLLQSALHPALFG